MFSVIYVPRTTLYLTLLNCLFRLVNVGYLSLVFFMCFALNYTMLLNNWSSSSLSGKHIYHTSFTRFCLLQVNRKKLIHIWVIYCSFEFLFFCFRPSSFDFLLCKMSMLYVRASIYGRVLTTVTWDWKSIITHQRSEIWSSILGLPSIFLKWSNGIFRTVSFTKSWTKPKVQRTQKFYAVATFLCDNYFVCIVLITDEQKFQILTHINLFAKMVKE